MLAVMFLCYFFLIFLNIFEEFFRFSNCRHLFFILFYHILEFSGLLFACIKHSKFLKIEFRLLRRLIFFFLFFKQTNFNNFLFEISQLFSCYSLKHFIDILSEFEKIKLCFLLEKGFDLKIQTIY